MTISLMMRQHSNRKVEGKEGWRVWGEHSGGGVEEKMRLKLSERWFGLPKMPSVSHGKDKTKKKENREKRKNEKVKD